MSDKSQAKRQATSDSPDVWVRIQQSLECRGIPAVARKMELTRQSVHEWQKGKMPGLDTLIKIAALGDVSLHWLITGEGTREVIFDKTLRGKANVVQVAFNDTDRQLMQMLAEEEGRSLEQQADRLIAEALIARGLVPSRFEMFAPILEILDKLPISRRQKIAKSLRDLSERVKREL